MRLTSFELGHGGQTCFKNKSKLASMFAGADCQSTGLIIYNHHLPYVCGIYHMCVNMD